MASARLMAGRMVVSCHASTLVKFLTIARTAHATGTDAVRGCALDTAASCLLGLKRWRGLALPIRHQRLVLLLGPDGQGAPDISGA